MAGPCVVRVFQKVSIILMYRLLLIVVTDTEQQTDILTKILVLGRICEKRGEGGNKGSRKVGKSTRRSEAEREKKREKAIPLDSSPKI